MFDINTHLISEITYQQIDKKNIIFVSNFFSYKKKNINIDQYSIVIAILKLEIILIFKIEAIYINRKNIYMYVYKH